MLASSFLYLNILNVFMRRFCIVWTTSGFVRGNDILVNNEVVEQYLNIPYAEPPIGKLRFSKPMALRTHSNDIIDDTTPRRTCFHTSTADSIFVESEDCLLLNIWTKRHSKENPVMVWFGGASLIQDSIYDRNGSVLSAHNVVVVKVNYRLGPLGWLYGDSKSAPGNVGLYDQLLALHWVKNNIHNFGGDPTQVTIFGQSTGSWCVTAHIMSPLSKGLFQKAIIQSGAFYHNKDRPVLSKQLALSQVKDMAQHFNCSQTNQWLDCLRTIDAKVLNSFDRITTFLIYDTEVLPFQPQQALKKGYFNQVDIMGGTVANETSLDYERFNPNSDNMHSKEDFQVMVEKVSHSVSLPFPNLNSQTITEFYLKGVDTNSSVDLKKAFFAFYGDLRIRCSTYFFVKQFAIRSLNSKVFFYYWNYVSRLIADELGCRQDMGVCHHSDVPYVFEEPVLKNMSDKSFSEYVMRFWTNFAKFSSPDTIKWPRFISYNKNKVTVTKELNPLKPNKLIKNIYYENCDRFWNNYFN